MKSYCIVLLETEASDQMERFVCFVSHQPFPKKLLKNRKKGAAYLAVLDDADSFPRSKEREMREANTGTVGEVDETPHLALLVFHQSLVSERVNAAHVCVRVLVGIEHTWKRVARVKGTDEYVITSVLRNSKVGTHVTFGSIRYRNCTPIDPAKGSSFKFLGNELERFAK